MQVSTVNISQMVTERANIFTIASNIISHVSFQLAHLEFNLTYSEIRLGHRNIIIILYLFINFFILPTSTKL